MGGLLVAELSVIRSCADAEAHDPHTPALVEVPGLRVKAMWRLVSVLEQPPKELAGLLHRLKSFDPGASLSGKGVVVTNIGPRSAAASAGMVRGDILLRYDGIALRTPSVLASLTSKTHGSGTARIEALRGSESLHFEVPVGRLGITANGLSTRPPTA
jgi:S1-C subfamily serine protease